jgi:enoyl-CoA hydratase
VLVQVEDRGAVRVLTLDRPQALNALSADLVEQLTRGLREAEADPAVRAIVLTGSDKAFCAGADITQIPQMQQAAPLERMPFDELFGALARLNTPTIAAVRGLALGGGCELTLACDTAIAGESAQFGVPEVKLGVLPGAGGTQRLVHALGKAKAMRMLLSVAPVSADWAERAGLVADVVPDDQVLDAAVALAETIAQNAPLAVRLAADAARHADEQGLSQGLDTERRNFLLLLGTQDATEGISAFQERRTPNFTGA